MVEDVVPDRVHQVRLAESHAAVDEQRVVGPRRRLGDGAAGGVRELVRGSDDEGVEGVAGSQAAGGRIAGLRFRGFGDRRKGRGRQVRDDRIDDRFRRIARDVFRDERDCRALAIDLAERLVQDRGIVLRQPVTEERVRHPHPQQRPLVCDERRRLEPGVEDVTVDLRLDAREDLVPDTAAVHDRLPSLC